MRVLFALPGLHRYSRGAETALIAIANCLAERGEEVTLIGSGAPRPGTRYRFLQAPLVGREAFEHFPFLPGLRNEMAYEELTFAPGLLLRYRPQAFDVTVTCSFPYTNLALRRPTLFGSSPRHVFVTENGDWPASSRRAEYRLFGCDGLVCTNPEYYERNRDRWRCRLIPNGVDCQRFNPGAPQRQRFGIPEGKFVVLMVSALVPNKRVQDAIKALSTIPDAFLVLAGDGPLRTSVDALAHSCLSGNYLRLSLSPEEMPDLYRSADTFLHICKDESFGNVYLEAMATGLPIVAHDYRLTRWILNDSDFLVDTDDVMSLRATIISARDRGNAKRSDQAERASSFSWKRIGEMYIDFFREILDRQPTAPA